MAINQPTYKPIVGTGATSKLVTNVSLPTINTEVSHTLQNGLRGILVRSREIAKIQVGFAVGESGTNYISVREGAVLFLDNLEWSSSTIYLQSDTITTVEILELYT